MRRFALLTFALGLLLPALAAAPAHAQTTRTWVSGVGDDANPCSRTAPCKTFAGAIALTAPAGEINCLDPGGFGSVTITKAITISCETGTAGVLASGNNGITISAGTGDFVFLKGLDIFGLGAGPGSGVVGIKFNTGAGLVVENCVINGFQAANGLGIGFNPTSNATLTVTNTLVINNGTAATGGGIQVLPANATATANAILSHVTVAKNGIGLAAVGAGGASVIQITDSVIQGNLNTGVLASGTGAVVRIGHSAITSNGGAATSGNVLSYLDNQINANGTDTTPASAGGYK